MAVRRQFSVFFSFLVFYPAFTNETAKKQTLVLTNKNVSLWTTLTYLNHETVLMWLFEDNTLLHHNGETALIEVQGRYTSLMKPKTSTIYFNITNVSLADAGTYSCRRYQTYEGKRDVLMWNLIVQGYPRLSLTADYWVENENASASCCVEFSPQLLYIQVKWCVSDYGCLNKAVIAEKKISANKLTTVCSSLRLFAKRIYHGKSLICSVQNDLNVSSVTTIKVMHSASVKVIEPQLQYNFGSWRVTQTGSRLNITCLSEGHPIPTVQLERKIGNNQWNICQTEEQYITSDTYGRTNVTFLEVIPELSMKYRCTAFNGIGSPSSTVEFVIDPSYESVFQGNVALLILAVVVPVLLTTITSSILTRRSMKKCRKPRHSQGERHKSLTMIDNIANPKGKHLQGNSCMVETMEQTIHFSHTLGKSSDPKRWVGVIKNEEMVDVKVICSTIKGRDRRTQDCWNCYLSELSKVSEHQNIITTLGFLEKSGSTYCVQEYLTGGTVQSFLENETRKDGKYGNIFEQISAERVCLAFDIIRGMQFLNSHGMSHPGLCARKLLLSTQKIACKLYDFCLTRHAMEKVKLIKKKDGSVTMFPPEVAYSDHYKLKSDIWAVGIALWEILLHGSALPIAADSLNCIDLRYEVPKMPRCPINIQDQVAKCWSSHMSGRPSYAELEECLKDLWGPYEKIWQTTEEHMDTSEMTGIEYDVVE